MRASVILFCLVLVGCEPVQFTKAKPKQEDVAGHYILTTASRAILAQAGYSSANAFLELKPDGTFDMKDMPDRWRAGVSLSQPTTNPSYDSGSGTWKIESHEEGWTKRWGVSLDFPHTKGFASFPRKGRYVNANVMLRNDTPSYVLYIGIGDPDVGEGLELIYEMK